MEPLDGVSLQGKVSYGCHFDQIGFFPLPYALNVCGWCVKLMVISGEEIWLMWCNGAKWVGFAFCNHAVLRVAAGSRDKRREAEQRSAGMNCEGRLGVSWVVGLTRGRTRDWSERHSVC